jgi:1L-myo-inositol 1-phosphate cytidylyltransferase
MPPENEPSPPAIKQCLIVAAGKGTRLKQFGAIKPLVDLGGKPLVEHAMAAAAAAGVEHFVIVTGYQSDVLSAALSAIAARNGWSVTTALNKDYERENGLSVLAAEAHLRGDFFLAMSDHVVDAALYARLAAAPLAGDAIALGVDYRLSNPDVDIDDVTKVRVDGGRIVDIGKSLTDYQAYDTGVFRANLSLFAAIRQARDSHHDCSISGGVKMLASGARAFAIDVAAARWIDVDSPAMHARAKAWISDAQNRRLDAAPR